MAHRFNSKPSANNNVSKYTHDRIGYGTGDCRKCGSISNLSITDPDGDSHLAVYNIIVTGDPGVGKTALVVRLLTGRYIGEYIPQLDMSYTNQVKLKEYECILRIWDISSINIKKHIDKADACLVVYSVTNEASAKAALQLVEKVGAKIKEKPNNSSMLVMCLANKSDCKRGRTVNESTVKVELDKCSVEHVQVSAASSHNVYETLDRVINIIKLRKLQYSTVKSSGRKLTLIRNYITFKPKS